MMMTFYLSVALIGLGTFLYRYSFMSGRFNFTLPRPLKKAMNYIPVSVLATLVALGFFTDEKGDLSLKLPALAAALVAILAALYFKRELLTIVLGLAAYWSIEQILTCL